MSDARDATLGRVRAALGRGRLPSLPEPRFTSAHHTPDPAALAAGFAREAAAVGCSVHGPLGAAEAGELAVSLVRETRAHDVMSWSAADLPLPGLRAHLIELGCRLRPPELPSDRAGRATRLQELALCGVGVTGALSALADTGTLVMASGPGRPRLSWLLPPVHLALLPVSRIQPDLPSFLACGRETASASANLVLVTGPSRTGDIELILTRGVHGPGVLHVVLLA